MKLTKADREMFVDAVMEDVPSIDYDKLAQVAVRDTLLAAAPKPVKELYKLHPSWLEGSNLRTPDGLSTIYTKLRVPEDGSDMLVTQYPDLWSQLAVWGEFNKKQREERKALRIKLNAMIAGHTTLKSATDALPEFEKYLPWDRDVVKDRSMPAVANVVTDLMKAGWPKEGTDGKETTA